MIISNHYGVSVCKPFFEAFELYVDRKYNSKQYVEVIKEIKELLIHIKRNNNSSVTSKALKRKV